MVDIIVTQFHPEKIILFGSYARGDAGPDSDVDLLVVSRKADGLRQQAVDIRSAIWQIPGAKDVIVCGAAQLGIESQKPWSVLHQVSKEGRILYAAS
jgi:predicted nucleotidyltransferase